jgi:hypothetical protein
MDQIARLRAHQKNIERYEHLHKSKVSEREARYLEKRLAEERLSMLALSHIPEGPTSSR